MQDDLGLGWVQFRFRMHDPAIGRFMVVDPLAEDYLYNSPYAFSENKVVAHFELEGLESRPARRGGRATGGNRPAISQLAREAAAIARGQSTFSTLGRRQKATFFRTRTFKTTSRGVGGNSASNSFGRSSGSGTRENPENTHTFGNASGNALKLGAQIVDQAQQIIDNAEEITVIESFNDESGAAFSLGVDIKVDDAETTAKLQDLENSFQQAVIDVARGDKSIEEFNKLESKDRQLKIAVAHSKLGSSPVNIAKEKIQNAEKIAEDERRLPVIKPSN